MKLQSSCQSSLTSKLFELFFPVSPVAKQRDAFWGSEFYLEREKMIASPISKIVRKLSALSVGCASGFLGKVTNDNQRAPARSSQMLRVRFQPADPKEVRGSSRERVHKSYELMEHPSSKSAYIFQL